MSDAARRIGPYVIGELLGEGSTGRVYSARRADTPGQEVALKRVRVRQRSSGAIERLAQEREFLSRLHHPNVAAVLDAGADDQNAPYLVMELVRGRSLLEHCEAAGSDLEQRLRLFLAACKGVRHAHQKGVIHRDIKPANILVAEVGGEQQPKVIDFGVATSRLDEDLGEPTPDSSRDFVGTLDYMAPECFDSARQSSDVRIDVYALGVILYELLVGEHPYREQRRQCRSLAEAAQWIRRFQPVRPSRRQRLRHGDDGAVRPPTGGARRIPSELDPVVLKAMAADASQRHPSVDVLIEDLELHLAGQAPRTTAPGLAPVLFRFLRRHAWLTGVAALIVLTLLLSTLVVMEERGRAEAALATAVEARERAKAFADVLRAEELVSTARRSWPLPGGLQRNRAWIERWLRDAGALTAGRDMADGRPVWGRLASEIAAMRRSGEILEATWPLWESVADWLGSHGVEPRLPPQAGLVPLGPDLDRQPRGEEPFEVLWAFAVGGTGRIPAWLDVEGRPVPYGRPGRAALTPESALLMVLLPGGTFLRGSQREDPDAPGYDPHSVLAEDRDQTFAQEGPPTRISLAPFFVGKTEVTNQHYRRFQVASGADQPDVAATTGFGSDDHPVVGIRWAEAGAFCEHFGLQLPTEAQWEFAARSGTVSPYWSGDARRRDVAWHFENSALTTHPVATSPRGPRPNHWGLHNVLGNAQEYCADSWAPTLADAMPDGSPPSSSVVSGAYACRGGSWNGPWSECRVTVRQRMLWFESTSVHGLRAARKLGFE